MKFWVIKENDCQPLPGWNDSYIFTIYRDKWSSLFSSLPSIWYHSGNQSIAPLYEDLYIIALSIYGIDKRIPRKLFEDRWTRDIDISIPVIRFEKWQGTENMWNELLSFLTGDHWNVSFRPTQAVCSEHNRKNRISIDLSRCNCVCLFSGGLDSFCGALQLLERGFSPCLIGHNEYPKLRAKQEGFALNFRKYYPTQECIFLGFTAGARAPYAVLDNGLLRGVENTSRGRSFLFLAFALTVAGLLGKDIPVFIPENGFIGLNIPLTKSRLGTCSTRTTHPFFIKSFLTIIKSVGITNPIVNQFAYNTKREIVWMFKDNPAFLDDFHHTISCSHPCQARYNKVGDRTYPINCGYCYPCLIRKSSLLDVIDCTRYSFSQLPSVFLSNFSHSDKSSDLNAVINSVYRYKKSTSQQIKRLILSTGPLSYDEVSKFEHVYTSGMSDIVELLERDPMMEMYI